MVRIPTATGASPCTRKSRALGAARSLTFLRYTVVLLEGVLAETLEIIGTVGRNVFETLAPAFGSAARSPFPRGIQIVMIFEFMVAEAFSFWSDHLALLSLSIPPR